MSAQWRNSRCANQMAADEAMFVSFAWLGPGETELSLEATAPFEFVGRQLAASRFAGRFIIIFLDGFANLSAHYCARLKELGFELVDFGDETRRIVGALAGLQRFGAYGLYCFARWPVLARYLATENVTGQVIHLDGDVVFNATPEEIALDLRGLTFVLQGCPAVASITDYRWFEAYESELRKFSADVDRYCAAAFANKDGWLQSAREKWAGVWQGPAIEHDQDLICYLIHTDSIVQDRPADFAPGWKLYYTQNPFWLHEGAQIQLGRETGLVFSVRDGVCYLQQKKIALWHFQSFFMQQLHLATELQRLGYGSRFPDSASSATEAKDWLAARGVGLPPTSRRELYLRIRELARDETVPFSFGDFYDPARFWRPDVFVNG